MQVAWQDLVAATGEGSVLDDTGHGKASTVGAVLTSLRLLLVSATLHVLVALPFGAVEAPATSMLWTGPALLFTNKNQQASLPHKENMSFLNCLISWAPVCRSAGVESTV